MTIAKQKRYSQPSVFASDAEVNIVIVTIVCPDGNRQTIKAYREEAQALREFIKHVDRQPF